MDGLMVLLVTVDWPSFDVAKAIRIAAIIVVTYLGLIILRRVLRPALRHAVEREMTDQPSIEVDKRVATLTQVVHSTAVVIALFVGLLTILPELGINITAILAGTSLLALAVGFGAQSLVKDVISGLFILIENQFGKGDVVNIAGVGGLVEDVNLRRTILRDLDGTIHSVPNGQINVASNLTRTWSRANLILSVSYESNMDHVFSVINRVGEALKSDPTWAADVVEAPKAIGIENFGDSGIDVRVLGVTQPIRQWDVMREFRRRVKAAFDEEGIVIPYPHRVIVSDAPATAQT